MTTLILKCVRADQIEKIVSLSSDSNVRWWTFTGGCVLGSQKTYCSWFRKCKRTSSLWRLDI